MKHQHHRQKALGKLRLQRRIARSMARRRGAALYCSGIAVAAALCGVLWNAAEGAHVLASFAMLLACCVAVLLFVSHKLWKETERLATKNAELKSVYEVYRDEANIIRQKADASRSSLIEMCHAMRSPLNEIIDAASMLETTVVDAKHRALVGRLRSCAGTALLNTSGVIDLSLGGVAWEPCTETMSVAAIVEAAVDAAEQRAYNQRVAVVANYPDDALLTDGVRLLRVLMSILDNAVKSTIDGAVAIIARHWEAADGVAWLQISVSDSGSGDASVVRERLFGDLENTMSGLAGGRGGPGLGLKVARCIVEAMGGTIGMEQREAGGCIVWFQVPTSHKSVGDTFAQEETDDIALGDVVDALEQRFTLSRRAPMIISQEVNHDAEAPHWRILTAERSFSLVGALTPGRISAALATASSPSVVERLEAPEGVRARAGGAGA